ncbi:MAG: hypothetical protein AB1540_11085, partial [Bdellovibrionota bacterium]
RAKKLDELRVYFNEYQARTGALNYLRHRLEEKSKDLFRSFVPQSSPLFKAARKSYWTFKGLMGR